MHEKLNPLSHEQLPSILICDKEYDCPELRRVIKRIIELGLRKSSEDWMLAGSQEISVFEMKKGTDVIFIQFETYMGVQVFANSDILEEFKEIAVPE